jgi:hypothetical protein
MDHRLQRRWKLGESIVGDIFLSTTFTGDIAYPSLQIEGTCFGRAVTQSVRLASRPMRFGGKRWYFVCPKTRRLCSKIILPPGGTAFASVKGWGISYRSQYDDAVTRTTKALAGLSKRAKELPKYTRSKTHAALHERIRIKEAFLDRVMQIVEDDLSCGRRMSLRRASRRAIAH